MKKLIRYTRHSSGGWNVWVNGVCLGVVTTGWVATTKIYPYTRGRAATRDEAAALLPGFRHHIQLAKLDRKTKLAAELVEMDAELSEHFTSYQEAEPDDGEARHECVEAMGHRLLDLLGMKR